MRGQGYDPDKGGHMAAEDRYAKLRETLLLGAGGGVLLAIILTFAMSGDQPWEFWVARIASLLLAADFVACYWLWLKGRRRNRCKKIAYGTLAFGGATAALVLGVLFANVKEHEVLLKGAALEADDEHMNGGLRCPGVSMTVIIGDSAYAMARFPWTAISFDGRPLLVLDKLPDGGIVATFDIYDAQGNLLVRVQRNNVEVIPLHAYMEPRRTTDRLRVLDEKGHTVLDIIYANPQLIVIEGKLFAGGQTLEMTDHGIVITGQNHPPAILAGIYGCRMGQGFDWRSTGIGF